MIDLDREFKDFQDWLAPRLDTYEQAIYLYILRHGPLQGLDAVVIGFKSARKKMAFGIGEHGKPMSEGSVYKKLTSLAQKGAVTIVGSERDGTRVRLLLPSHIPGLIPGPGPLGTVAERTRCATVRVAGCVPRLDDACHATGLDARLG